MPRTALPPTAHPDRLLPPDPATRTIARDLYDAVSAMPIISPHGHVPASWFAQDLHFRNPTDLFITPDHYLTRILHASGVPLADLGVRQRDFGGERARHAFLLLGEHWPAFAGTPVRYWFEDSLTRVFGISRRFGPDTAGAIYDELDAMLADDEFTTRRLVERFNIAFISTTDDPCDDLAVHDQTNADPAFSPRLAPAFRPDRYLEPARADFAALAAALGDAAGCDTSTYAGHVEAMRVRRRHFKAHGAVLSDHSHADAGFARLDGRQAETLYAEALAGRITAADAHRLRRHMMADQAALAREDGLVMTIHPGVHRDYDEATLAGYGHDSGADLPSRIEFTEALRPLLNECGDDPDFHLVAFTMDESVYSRELAPLAGFYPSLYIGAPWWFIDAPEPIGRYYADVVPAAGFTKLSGFIDDTRALCSIPARHDMSRRLTARYVASLVADHRLSLDEGVRIMRDSVDAQPRRVFKLPACGTHNDQQ